MAYTQQCIRIGNIKNLHTRCVIGKIGIVTIYPDIACASRCIISLKPQMDVSDQIYLFFAGPVISIGDIKIISRDIDGISISWRSIIDDNPRSVMI